MTDIDKDFISWYKIEFGEEPNLSCDDTHWIKFGYQAGRAHNVDGLIAEISKGISLGSNPEGDVAIESCISIIRKHFGKE